jgi:hypothetical protein
MVEMVDDGPKGVVDGFVLDDGVSSPQRRSVECFTNAVAYLTKSLHTTIFW